MKRAFAVIAVTFLAANAVVAQVHIKESAVITPGQTKSVQSMYDDPFNPKYPRVGGTVTAKLYIIPNVPYPQWLYGFGGQPFGEANTMTIDLDSTLTFQEIPQWSKLYLYLFFSDSAGMYHPLNDYDQVIEP